MPRNLQSRRRAILFLTRFSIPPTWCVDRSWDPLEACCFLNPLGQMSRSLWLKQINNVLAITQDLVYYLQTWFVDWSLSPPEAYSLWATEVRS